MNKQEFVDFVGTKWDEVKTNIEEVSRKDERDRLKHHFDYLARHCGYRCDTYWMRNELFGKD